MSTEERKTAREKEETPILEKFWQWIDVNQGRCLPKSLLGKAFIYAQNQKDGLMNYLQYGKLRYDQQRSREQHPAFCGWPKELGVQHGRARSGSQRRRIQHNRNSKGQWARLSEIPDIPV